MKKWYEIREINVQHSFGRNTGHHASELRKEFGVFVMPYNVNTYIASTREQAEAYVAKKSTVETA